MPMGPITGWLPQGWVAYPCGRRTVHESPTEVRAASGWQRPTVPVGSS